MSFRGDPSDPYQDDAWLLKQAAQGGPDADLAMATLYQRHFQTVYAALSHMDGQHSVQDREDLTQLVFLEVLQRRCSFQGESSIGHYCAKIARHLLNNQLRSDAWRVGRETTKVNAATPEASGPHAKLLQKEAIEALRQTIAQLPPDQQQAIELTHFKGLNHREAALEAGCSAAAMQSRHRRAKAFLKGTLEELCDDARHSAPKRKS